MYFFAKVCYNFTYEGIYFVFKVINIFILNIIAFSKMYYLILITRRSLPTVHIWNPLR